MTDIPNIFEMRGTVTEKQTPTRRASRPRFSREVVAPTLIFACASAGLVIGSGLAAWFVVGPEPSPVKAILCAGLVAASIGGGLAAVYQLPHYRRLQWDIEREAKLPRPRTDNERGRIMSSTSPRTRAVTRCEWSMNWRRRLAQRVLDDEGNWISSDRPTRTLFTGLVTALSDKWNPGGGEVFADLQNLDWLDDAGNWTNTARRELRNELFFGG